MVLLILLVAGLAVVAPPAGAETAEEALATADAAYARRAEGARGAVADPVRVEEALAGYRRALAAQPDNRPALLGLLRALHFRAAFCGAREAERKALFEEGRRRAQAAVDALEKQAAARGGERIAALREAPQAALVYYWAAVHWGQWGLLRGKLTSARAGVASKVRDDAETVLALDPQLEEGGADRLLGRLHDQAPKILFVTGWISKRKGLEHLRRSLALGPRNSVTRFFLAEAILEHDPAHREEARGLLSLCATSPPRPEFLVEDAHYAALARARLAALK
jgi:hypothetical protein